MLILDKQLEIQIRSDVLLDAFKALKNYIQIRINMFDEPALIVTTCPEPFNVFLSEDRYHVFSTTHDKDQKIMKYLTQEQIKCYIQACAQKKLDKKNANT